MAAETETNVKQAASVPEDRAEPVNVFGRLRLFLKTGMGRIALCTCAAVLVTAVVLAVILVRGAIGDHRLEGWPSGTLMEGIQPPEQGRIVSVSRAETTVTVYFEEFPESELAPYLQTLGVPYTGDPPYVVQKGEDRFLAIVYDPAAERLSLTVTPSM